MDLKIFKAYDVRGTYPTQIDEDAAYQIGRGFARFLSAKQIVVGRDVRQSSPALSEKLIEGLTCEGVDVIDIGECTTPMMNFAVSSYDYDGGMMVTASHNPAQDNGVKIVTKENGPLFEGYGLPELKKMVEAGFGDCSSTGTVTKHDVLNDYVAHVLSAVKNIEGLKVVVDYGNGMGAVSAKPAFARLDINTVDLYEEPDGTFPNHPANPHDIENFTDLQKAVLDSKADIGVFFDGDADRAFLVDNQGQVVPTDLLTVLLAREELIEKPNESVYYDLRFSKSVPDQIKAAGGKPEMLRVGNAFYKKKLKADGGVLGSEFSGHLMFWDNYFIDDGLFVVIKVLNLLTAKKQKMSELVKSVKIYEASDEESYEAKHPDTVFERLISAFSSAKLVELDGVYLDFPDGFISVRQSQNEPQLFRLRVEAKTPHDLKERLEKTRQIVKE
jgi:phosphomannomutase